MTTRILPAAEWAKLAGTELEAVWPVLNPETAKVVVVEDHAQIIGCWALIPSWHVEGCWVAEPHRKRGVVARKLWQVMSALASAFGARALFTGCKSDEVRQLLTRHLSALQLEGEHFVIPVR